MPSNVMSLSSSTLSLVLNTKMGKEAGEVIFYKPEWSEWEWGGTLYRILQCVQMMHWITWIKFSQVALFVNIIMNEIMYFFINHDFAHSRIMSRIISTLIHAAKFSINIRFKLIKSDFENCIIPRDAKLLTGHRVLWCQIYHVLFFGHACHKHV